MQQFSKFPQLPYDIRHRIWEVAIYVPGIHFLRFEGNEDFKPAYGTTERGVAPGYSASPYSARLAPLFENPEGDISHYLSRNTTLDRIASSCSEAKRLVWQALRHRDNLRLGHGYLETGPLVSFALGDDIVCVDYPEMQKPASVRLGKWASWVDRSQLSKISKLAVRYQVSWGEDTRLCPGCGRVHESRRRTPKLPEHLFHFLTLFPRLDTLYLIDSFAAPKVMDHKKSMLPPCLCVSVSFWLTHRPQPKTHVSLQRRLTAVVGDTSSRSRQTM